MNAIVDAPKQYLTREEIEALLDSRAIGHAANGTEIIVDVRPAVRLAPAIEEDGVALYRYSAISHLIEVSQ